MSNEVPGDAEADPAGIETHWHRIFMLLNKYSLNRVILLMASLLPDPIIQIYLTV